MNEEKKGELFDDLFRGWLAAPVLCHKSIGIPMLKKYF
jgi:hypothetical protein